MTRRRCARPTLASPWVWSGPTSPAKQPTHPHGRQLRQHRRRRRGGAHRFANIRKFMTYILASNIPEIVPYLAFVLFRYRWLLTIIRSSRSISAPTCCRPWRWQQSVLSLEPWIARQGGDRTPAESAPAGAGLSVPRADAGDRGYGGVLLRAGRCRLELWRARCATDPVYLRATTACLVAIVVMQIANVFLCRSPHLSIFALGPLSNRLILVGVLAR